MLISWVKSGLLFGVFASVMLMLCPNKSYMKHISMVVGLLFILVMLHPVMKLCSVDVSVYADYIKNYLLLEEENTEITDYDYRLYEVSVASQLESVFLQKGYPIEEIKIDTDKNGKIMNITLHFGEGEYCIQNVENYLHELLGEDVKITYE